jgi:hypothetical protein
LVGALIHQHHRAGAAGTQRKDERAEQNIERDAGQENTYGVFVAPQPSAPDQAHCPEGPTIVEVDGRHLLARLHRAVGEDFLGCGPAVANRHGRIGVVLAGLFQDDVGLEDESDQLNEGAPSGRHGGGSRDTVVDRCL